MKKIVLFLALTLSSLAVLAQDDVRIGEQPVVHEGLPFGYLSYKDVFTHMQGYEEAMQQIAELRAAYEQELKRNEEQFSKQFAEYVEGQKSFTEIILLKRQKELQVLMEQNLQFKQEAQRLLKDSEEKVLEPLRQRLTDAIHRIGMSRNYPYVLNTDNNAYPFINGDLGTDISADVLELLK